MLLDFSVANFLSLDRSKTLSLVASALKDPKNGLIYSSSAPPTGVLPAVIVYGANASGKSNLVAALRFLCNSVDFSHSQGTPQSSIPRVPFALHPAEKDAPTELGVNFISGETRYQYGFSC